MKWMYPIIFIIFIIMYKFIIRYTSIDERLIYAYLAFYFNLSLLIPTIFLTFKKNNKTIYILWIFIIISSMLLCEIDF